MLSTVSSGVAGVFYRIVSPPNTRLSYKFFWKLTLVLLCLLSTTTTTTSKMSKYILANGIDLVGFRFLLMDHTSPDFEAFGIALQNQFDTQIGSATIVTGLFEDATRKKMKDDALDSLRHLYSDQIVTLSNHGKSSSEGKAGKKIFMDLPLLWKNKQGQMIKIMTDDDLGKAIQYSITEPHLSHRYYENEMVVYVAISHLYCF